MYDSEVRKRTTKAQGKQEGLTIGKKAEIKELENQTDMPVLL